MAYLDHYMLHSNPLTPTKRPQPDPEPTSILFSMGPEWTRRYQVNQEANKLDKRFMYKDQGPPTYRKMGAHNNMYNIPIQTDHSTFAKSFHYEPRMGNAPNYKNGAIAFPPGPPPPQIAMIDGFPGARDGRQPEYKNFQIPSISDMSVKAYDKYRYLPGPPPDTHVYGQDHKFGGCPL